MNRILSILRCVFTGWTLGPVHAANGSSAALAKEEPRGDETTIAGPARTSPNFIVILTDDLGYGGLGCYGAEDVATPAVDRMAKEGVRFTSFYVSPVCSPSRAGLMIGCYPQQVGMGGVLFPRNPVGLHYRRANATPGPV